MRKSVVIFLTLAMAVAVAAIFMGRRPVRPQVAKPIVATQPDVSRVQPVRINRDDLAAVAVKADRVRPVLGLASESYADREKALSKLVGTNLKPEEIGAIVAYLNSRGDFPGMIAGREQVLKNNLMDLLIQQTPPPTNLLETLCGIYQDKGQDAVLQNYAIQHVISSCLASTNQPPTERQAALDVLWVAVGETDASLAGTALMGLDRLAAKGRAIETNRLNETALKLALNPVSGELARVTALQVCAKRRLGDVLPEALKLAQEGVSVPLRASAIATIGVLGGESERTILRTMKKQGDKRLQAAVLAALQKLNAKLPPSKA